MWCPLSLVVPHLALTSLEWFPLQTPKRDKNERRFAVSLENRVVPSVNTIGVVVFALFVAVPSAQADGLPDWAVRSALSGAFAAQMADATLTYRNLSHPCTCYTELNPLLPNQAGANLAGGQYQTRRPATSRGPSVVLPAASARSAVSPKVLFQVTPTYGANSRRNS